MAHRKTTDRNGFRYRGGENTRIEAFTDAAFAFAVTLLMIGGGHVPTDVGQLKSALQGVPAYAASFALLCLFWHAHYLWYRRYGIEDGASIFLSLLLVFMVLIYIYPLHMMFNAAIYAGNGSQAAHLPARAAADWETIYVIFGIAYASMSVVILLFYHHALRMRGSLELDAREVIITRAGLLRWALSVGIGLLSALLAWWLLPANARTTSLVAIPGLTYWLIALGNVFLKRRMLSQLASLSVAP
ncbi:MAG: DUF1211 domain-containing protein [Proteobacteria bacterium]|nr:DUF1211 domain-containing protein [Pseudomonadota bacterium]